MTISSRTPEGDPNCCPICGNDIRLEPSTTPTRDAPCPHCGHLLWFEPFDEEPTTLPERSSKSYEGILLKLARLRFGAIPPNLIHPLTEAVGPLVRSRRLHTSADIEFVVNAANSWEDLVLRLRHAADLPARRSWRRAVTNFMSHQLRRLAPRRLPKRRA